MNKGVVYQFLQRNEISLWHCIHFQMTNALKIWIQTFSVKLVFTWVKFRCAKFSDGLWSIEKLLYEDKAVSSNLAFIKDKSSPHKFSSFTSQKNNSKGSKKFEYSTDLGFMEKVRPLHNMLFSTSLNLCEENLSPD